MSKNTTSGRFLVIFLMTGLLAVASEAATAAPSFDCTRVERASIETLVCNDEELGILDGQLADVYAAAARKAVNEHPPVLAAEQRGWIKGRNDCWKSAEQRSCVKEEYQRRIAELQARYHLVPGRGPITYACDGDPRSQVVVTFYQTEPPTLVAERGDRTALMYLQRCESGDKYVGANEGFWEHHNGEALITWGFGAQAMRCRCSP